MPCEPHLGHVGKKRAVQQVGARTAHVDPAADAGERPVAGDQAVLRPHAGADEIHAAGIAADGRVVRHDAAPQRRRSAIEKDAAGDGVTGYRGGFGPIAGDRATLSQGAVVDGDAARAGAPLDGQQPVTDDAGVEQPDARSVEEDRSPPARLVVGHDTPLHGAADHVDSCRMIPGRAARDPRVANLAARDHPPRYLHDMVSEYRLAVGNHAVGDRAGLEQQRVPGAVHQAVGRIVAGIGLRQREPLDPRPRRVDGQQPPRAGIAAGGSLRPDDDRGRRIGRSDDQIVRDFDTRIVEQRISAVRHEDHVLVHCGVHGILQIAVGVGPVAAIDESRACRGDMQHPAEDGGYGARLVGGEDECGLELLAHRHVAGPAREGTPGLGRRGRHGHGAAGRVPAARGGHHSSGTRRDPDPELEAPLPLQRHQIAFCRRKGAVRDMLRIVLRHRAGSIAVADRQLPSDKRILDRRGLSGDNRNARRDLHSVRHRPAAVSGKAAADRRAVLVRRAPDPEIILREIHLDRHGRAGDDTCVDILRAGRFDVGDRLVAGRQARCTGEQQTERYQRQCKGSFHCFVSVDGFILTRLPHRNRQPPSTRPYVLFRCARRGKTFTSIP